MIALITDFGYTDHFVGVVKGVLKSLDPGAEVVDISHSVKSYSILNAQFILYSSYRYFPEGTVFCVIVDPGVGTERKGLIAADGRYFFVMPDNGIISAVITDTMKLYHIDMAPFKNASSTFHGRDVFAPVASGLSRGTPPERYGKPADSVVTAPFPRYTAAPESMKCGIIHIDKFGNAITSLPVNTIDFEACSLYSVSSGRYRFKSICVRTYGDLFKGQCGIIRGSSGFIELALSMSSIAEKHRMSIGDQLTLRPLSTTRAPAP
ncbi:MAG TPA: SAM-dependent chlorinase/fluorinase [Spirochaetota bacterium]|nr:SAM-dependent chlorinase/fluorinase [Spirochaetota bacterium]HPC43275.1 SAM-dependent chlorinase/fluorinase [Spirochaetota bacterium]HPL16536.1 SAM-dependent chlorinase/fluorinase [Spirochaetota bacterium]HQF06695.1 SAM-dependent chlorinase/fluorinase [Spirochaetota bacterium]HQH95902.1 SAM-dependent chlorinase/fluorinase [Spirochaetota bacterium]